jgi:hypothetical protein
MWTVEYSRVGGNAVSRNATRLQSCLETIIALLEMCAVVRRPRYTIASPTLELGSV